MKIIGIDSSTTVISVALLEDDKLIAEVVLNTQKKHSQRLMPMIDMILNEAGISAKDLDAIAVSSGPGSFTGLRIGITTAKALAWSLSKPLVAVSSLDALAANVQCKAQLICPVLNARRKEVYTAIYTMEDNKLRLLSDYMVCTPDELIEILQQKDGQIVLLGDGVEEVAEVFQNKIADRLEILKTIDRLPRASRIAYLGWQKLQKGETEDVMQLTPLYIRPSEAEKKLESAKILSR